MKKLNKKELKQLLELLSRLHCDLCYEKISDNIVLFDLTFKDICNIIAEKLYGVKNGLE